MSCGLDSAQPVVSAGRLEGGDATFGVAIFFGLATPMAPIVSRYLLLRGSTEPLIKHISADICLQNRVRSTSSSWSKTHSMKRSYARSKGWLRVLLHDWRSDGENLSGSLRLLRT
jgi:hypothetical protein